MARDKFFLQLEKYVFGKMRSLPSFSVELLAVGFFVLVSAGSIMLFEESKTALNAGAYPTESSLVYDLIADTSKRGDYETAEKIYSEQRVLGASSEEALEYLVYPERYVGHITRQFEELVDESPYWRDGLEILMSLYISSGNLEKADAYRERVEWLDPNLLD